MSEQRILSEWLCVPLLGDLFARFVDLLFYCTVYCCESSGVKVPDKTESSLVRKSSQPHNSGFVSTNIKL